MGDSWNELVEKFIVRESFTVGIGDKGRDLMGWGVVSGEHPCVFIGVRERVY